MSTATEAVPNGLLRHRRQPTLPARSQRASPPASAPLASAFSSTELKSFSAAANGIHDDEDDLGLPKEHAHRSELARLWLASRLISSNPPKFRPGGEDRPLTIRNIRLALRISQLIWRDVLRLFFGGEQVAMAYHILGKFVRGTLPVCRIWASSAMLDLVQRSFECGVETSEVLRTAGLNLLFHASNDLFYYMTQTNDLAIQCHINYAFSRAHLRSQLSLSLPALSSPYASALLYESGVMAGIEMRIRSTGSMTTNEPFYTLDGGLLQIPVVATQIITQLILLLRTIRCGGSEFWSWSSAFLIVLSLAPCLMQISSNWSGLMSFNRMQARGMRDTMQRHRAVRELGRNGSYKQEIVLFGLRDWVMDKWDAATAAMHQEQLHRRQKTGLTQLGLGMGQEGVQTAFYGALKRQVLLALRVLATNLSLGAIRLYQSTVKALLDSILGVRAIADGVFQSTFYLAAYIEAMDIPERPEKLYSASHSTGPLTNYEDTRGGSGMAIEARDFGFSYPGTDVPTLHDINLSIPAGDTLAIVGFNGGGKTTLVKALMGLYDHTGSLTINGLDSHKIDPDSMHKRTSCLFQDFSKYALTLRENIGVGNVDYILDDAMIERAIERGDAGQVLEKVGMDGELNRHPIAKPSNEQISISAKPSVATARALPAPSTPRLNGAADNEKTDTATEANGSSPPTPSTLGRVSAKVTKVLGISDRPPLPESWRREHQDTAQSLSGGQWQRVALARAFLRADEADLVVFDEPSASLDPKAEAELFQRIHALSHKNGRKTTTIYISHRFSTVRRADRIAVVERGTITEQGTHAELIALRGRYFELYNLQAEGFIDD